MPRSAGGAYTVPSGVPAVSGATISSSDYNNLLDDLEGELTDSLSRSGKGALTADMSAGGFKIANLAAGTNPNDAVRLAQLTAGYQPLDADLTTIAGLTATTDNFLQSKSSAWASRTPTQVTADLIAVVGDSGSGGTKGLVPAPASGDAAAGKLLAANGTWKAPATQAEQEAGTSVLVHVTPGRQHFHLSAAKCFAYVTVSGGTPSLNAASYNITSVTDTGTGILTVTIANDFSSAAWIAVATSERTTTGGTETTTLVISVRNGSMAAGSIALDAKDVSGSANLVDPAAWHLVGYGDL